MSTEQSKVILGWRIYAFGVMGLGIASLVFREFDPGQPVPPHFPHRTVLACVAGVLMVVAATLIQWYRSVAWGALTLAIYYMLFVVILMDGGLWLTGYGVFCTYENTAMPLALAFAAVIIYATAGRMHGAWPARLIRLSQLGFGLCTLVWGAAHFVYMNLTAPLVPRWLPPGQVFWGYATGICFLLAGAAILAGIRARLAATLLTIMIACFGLLVNDRILFTGLSSHFNWSESALNLALAGAAWTVATSLKPAEI